MGDTLNRRINLLLYQISVSIYESDQNHGDGTGWFPIRPIVLDYAVGPFVFTELIRLIRKAELSGKEREAIASFGTRDVIFEFQYIWPALGFTPNDISYEDKLYLISKLLDYSEQLPKRDSFAYIYQNLERHFQGQTPELEKVIRVGSQFYMNYLRPLYTLVDEDFDSALKKVQELAVKNAHKVKDPGPWGDKGEYEAVKRLIRNADFRREKERGLEQVTRGIGELTGIIEGVVGENIIVGFDIESRSDQTDAYITDISAFKSVAKEKFADSGIVIISKTRNGTHKLKSGMKVLVDGTSGIVYKK